MKAGDIELSVVHDSGEHHSVQPRVTVAISLFNYREFIVSCLDSVRAQTIDALEVIVVDDCSTDDGADLVRAWAGTHGNRFTRFALARHRVNRGLASARNTAFRLARAPYVFVLDADNAIYPRCLAQLATALDHCEASFAYSYVERFGESVGLHNLRPWNPSGFRNGNAIDAMVLLRKAVWETVGGYSIDMPVMGWEDFDLWFKVARARGWGIQVPEILGRYRTHRDSMISMVTNPGADALWAHLRGRYAEFFETDSRDG